MVAILVEFTCPGASAQQLQQAEAMATERGERLGRPPYDGCMFLAVTAGVDGPRFTSVWRTEAAFVATLHAALGPDLASAGITPTAPAMTQVLAMAMPGAHHS